MKKGRNATQEEKDKAVEDFKNGQTMKAIAKRTGWTAGSISNWVKKSGGSPVTRASKGGEDGGIRKMKAFNGVVKALFGLSKQEREEVLSSAQILLQ